MQGTVSSYSNLRAPQTQAMGGGMGASTEKDRLLKSGAKAGGTLAVTSTFETGAKPALKPLPKNAQREQQSINGDDTFEGALGNDGGAYDIGWVAAQDLAAGNQGPIPTASEGISKIIHGPVHGVGGAKGDCCCDCACPDCACDFGNCDCNCDCGDCF